MSNKCLKMHIYIKIDIEAKVLKHRINKHIKTKQYNEK